MNSLLDKLILLFYYFLAKDLINIHQYCVLKCTNQPNYVGMKREGFKIGPYGAVEIINKNNIGSSSGTKEEN